MPQKNLNNAWKSKDHCLNNYTFNLSFRFWDDDGSEECCKILFLNFTACISESRWVSHIFVLFRIINLCTYVKFSEKTNISYHLIRTRTSAYQGVKNVSFLGKFCIRKKWMIPNVIYYFKASQESTSKIVNTRKHRPANIYLFKVKNRNTKKTVFLLLIYNIFHTFI